MDYLFIEKGVDFSKCTHICHALAPSPPTILFFNFMTTPCVTFPYCEESWGSYGPPSLNRWENRGTERERALLKITQQVINRARAESQTYQYSYGRLRPMPRKATYSQHWYLMSPDLENRFKKGPSLTYLRLTTPTSHESRLLSSVQQLFIKSLL